MSMRKKTRDPMQLKTPEEAFYDFFKHTFPKYKMDFHVRDFAKSCFLSGVVWSHARIRADIESDLKDLYGQMKESDNNDKQ